MASEIKEADNGTWRVSCRDHNMPEVDFISHPTYIGASGLPYETAVIVSDAHNLAFHDDDDVELTHIFDQDETESLEGPKPPTHFGTPKTNPRKLDG
jgi:hypothetical protein